MTTLKFENGVRASNGKDYSKLRFLGTGLSKLQVDIKTEYEVYRNSIKNPVKEI